MNTELRLLQELPGITDVVWAIRARLGNERHGVRLLFAAAEPRAGTTVIAAATALALARHLREPVCLIETHVRRPSLALQLGLRTAGLTDVLDGRARLEDCLQSLERCPDLKLLTAGTPRKPAAGEFATARMRALLSEAAAGARYLVLDAPPLLEHIESRLLLQQADGAVLVLRAHATRNDHIERVRQILLESGTPFLGSVFNAQRSSLFAHSGNGAAYDPIPQMSAEPPPPPPRRSLAAHAPAVPGPRAQEPGTVSDAEHRREVELLERRIARLSEQLERTEAELAQLAALKDFDPGIASIYRGLQGLSPRDEAFASKTDLMKQLFEANLELKQTMERRRAAGTPIAMKLDQPQ